MSKTIDNGIFAVVLFEHKENKERKDGKGAMTLLATTVFALAFPANGHITAPSVFPTHVEAAQVFAKSEQLIIGTEYVLTAYSCSESQGTSLCLARWTGERPIEGRTIASNDLPPGTVVDIEGVGLRTVEDSGGGLGFLHLDVYFDDYATAIQFGKQYRQVRVQAKEGRE